MAGFDEPQKIITGLQLYQQGIIDKQTLQENMDGLENITKIQQRVNKERAETVLFETLMAQASQGDQKALIAAIEIRKNPQKMSEILDKYYTAEGEEPSEEELALIAAQQAPQAGGVPQGPPPGLAQVLSQVAQQGGQ